jgi:hypothetical protein
MSPLLLISLFVTVSSIDLIEQEIESTKDLIQLLEKRIQAINTFRKTLIDSGELIPVR